MTQDKAINRQFDKEVEKLCKALLIKSTSIRSLDRARIYVNAGFLSIEQVMVALTDEATMNLDFEDSLKIRGWLPGEEADAPAPELPAAPSPDWTSLKPLVSSNNLPLTISLTLEALRSGGLKSVWDKLIALELQVLDPLGTGKVEPAVKTQVENGYAHILERFGENATTEMLLRQLERLLKTVMLDPEALAYNGKDDPPIDQAYYEMHRGLFKLPTRETVSEKRRALSDLVKAAAANSANDEMDALRALEDFVGSMEKKRTDSEKAFEAALKKLKDTGLNEAWDDVVLAIGYASDPLNFHSHNKAQLEHIEEQLTFMVAEFTEKPVTEQLLKRLNAIMEVINSTELIPRPPEYDCSEELAQAFSKLFSSSPHKCEDCQ